VEEPCAILLAIRACTQTALRLLSCRVFPLRPRQLGVGQRKTTPAVCRHRRAWSLSQLAAIYMKSWGKPELSEAVRDGLYVKLIVGYYVIVVRQRTNLGTYPHLLGSRRAPQDAKLVT
jgi:hypothetical protein